MTDRYIVFDLETKDPHLSDLGAGWATGTGEVLYSCWKFDYTPPHTGDGNPPASVFNFNKGAKIIAHNIMYDIGWVWDDIQNIDDFELVDTMLMAKLVNNTEKSYSLDYLSQKYLGKQKTQDELAQWCIDNDYIPNVKVGRLERAKRFAMSNLDLLPRELVIKYCEQDVRLTEELYHFYKDKVSPEWMHRMSNCLKALVAARKRGVKIDRKQLFNVSKTLKSKIKTVYNEVYNELSNSGFPLGEFPDVNLKSPILMKALADHYNLPYKLSPKGNPVLDKYWLEQQDAPICELIKEYKRYEVSYNNFCLKLIKQQRMLPLSHRGRIYPEFKIFGATRTGRMSGQNPNIQQVPGRDEEIGPLIRSIYAADPTTTWMSCDFSSQETVLQVHYAKLIGAPGVDDIISSYMTDPEFDFHTYGASICGLDRKEAKTINLGKAYGMGVVKMARSLGCSEERAREVINQYDTQMPYLVTLMQKTMDTMKERGYIKTILGRKLYNDKPIWDKKLGKFLTFEYKALNKLIQGSAADQIYESISLCWEHKVPILFAVHDEINFALPEQYKLNGDLITLRRNLMENSLSLKIPMKTDCGLGDNWADAK